MAQTNGKKINQELENGTHKYGMFQTGINYNEDRERLIRLAERMSKSNLK